MSWVFFLVLQVLCSGSFDVPSMAKLSPKLPAQLQISGGEFHQYFGLWCSIAIGVREIVDLHSQVCDVAFYATSSLAVDATHFLAACLATR